MPDMGALAAALTSFKAAKDIAEAMVSLRDAAAFQTKLIEFQGKIIDANTAVFAAQDERTAMLEQVSALKAEVTDLKAWDAEKQNYELKPNFGGGVAFMLKPEARGTEPAHWLCPQCFSNGKKGYLVPSDHTGGIHRTYTCLECKTGRYMYGKPQWQDDPAQTS